MEDAIHHPLERNINIGDNKVETEGVKRTRIIKGGQKVNQFNGRKKYDPLDCKHMVNGHCQDDDGKAWSYRDETGNCIHTTEDEYPGNVGASQHLQVLLNPTSVLDFGGGVGVYLRAFRDSGINDTQRLVIVEPKDLGTCLFHGLNQDTRDWLHTPLSALPFKEHDLTMTIEVLEHIPIQFHQHLLKALAQASRFWLVLSAAHPGQPGEGHVGPSMKWREEWIQLVQNWTNFSYDEQMNTEFRKFKIGRLFRQNAAIFRRISET